MNLMDRFGLYVTTHADRKYQEFYLLDDFNSNWALVDRVAV